MKQKTKLTVGIIGLGKMGSALAKGLVKKRFAVVGTDPKPAKIMGLKFLKSIEQVVSVSQVVLLCVKPKSFPEVPSLSVRRGAQCRASLKNALPLRFL